MNSYDKDTLVTVSSDDPPFTDADGMPTDPASVTLYICPPGTKDADAQALTGGDLTHGAAGIYSYGIDANAPGYWWYQWRGTGGVEVRGPKLRFYVRGGLG